ncbi:MAG: hypothetical protein HY236_10735 [Acidobacteria bacterium]|nr:hypothetical protein [Acidobacteriota bacterium]
MVRKAMLWCLCLAATAPAQRGRDVELDSRPHLAMPSAPAVEQRELEVVSMDPEKREVVLLDRNENRQYSLRVDKATKLSADKKLLRRKPELSDFGKGDMVRASLTAPGAGGVQLTSGEVIQQGGEMRLVEIRLLKKSQPGS